MHMILFNEIASDDIEPVEPVESEDDFSYRDDLA